MCGGLAWSNKIMGERVRDMIYVAELNKIILFFEETPSIGMLSPK